MNILSQFFRTKLNSVICKDAFEFWNIDRPGLTNWNVLWKNRDLEAVNALFLCLSFTFSLAWSISNNNQIYFWFYETPVNILCLNANQETFIIAVLKLISRKFAMWLASIFHVQGMPRPGSPGITAFSLLIPLNQWKNGVPGNVLYYMFLLWMRKLLSQIFPSFTNNFTSAFESTFVGSKIHVFTMTKCYDLIGNRCVALSCIAWFDIISISLCPTIEMFRAQK